MRFEGFQDAAYNKVKVIAMRSFRLLRVLMKFICRFLSALNCNLASTVTSLKILDGIAIQFSSQ